MGHSGIVLLGSNKSFAKKLNLKGVTKNSLNRHLNKLQDKKQEVLFWAITANTMMNYGLWQSVHVLINEGIVDKNTRGIENFVNEDSGYLNIVLQAETIMDRVVIQYLNDTLPAN